VKEYQLGKYTLVYDMNALCEAEEKVGPLGLLLSDTAAAGSLKTIRSLLWAGLLRNHKVTLEEAGQIADELGIAEASAGVKAAILKAYGTDTSGEEGSGKPTPE